MINVLKNAVENFNTIEYVTDGCSEQYKNRKSFVNIVYHVSDFQVIGIWTFFATSHGKSSCDGIGGTIKRCTTNESLRRDADQAIIDAKMMADYCKETFPSIHIEVITADDIQETSSLIEPRYNRTTTFAGTRSYHYFEHKGDGKIGAKILSCDADFEKVAYHADILNNEISCFSPGSYLAFVYDHKWYIGIVSEVTEIDAEMLISSMHPAGPASAFFWPARPETV